MDESTTFRPSATRLMDQVRETLRFHHYAYNTEKSYVEILPENKKPDYCPRIERQIYYFDNSGRIILDDPFYFDLLQGLSDDAGGVISLKHRRNKKAAFDKYYWELTSQPIQSVIACIW